MNKEVLITVKNKQIIDGEEDIIELVTPGKFYKKEDFYYVVYDETEISCMKGTTTTLKIGDGSMSMIRMGSTNSKLYFKRGVNDTSLYQTPYGMLELVVKPYQVAIDVGDDGGEIKLVYDLESSGIKTSTNELLIKIR